MDRAAAAKLSEDNAPKFQALAGHGLRTKHFLYQEADSLGGGFYAWETRGGRRRRSTAKHGSIPWKNAWARAPN